MLQRRDHSSAVGDAHVSGAGSVVVLLHGMTGTWHMWAPVIPLLEPHHRLVALTLPGHDGGPALASGMEPNVANLADTLITMLRARGIESAHVVGNSLGGWLALELARRKFARSVIAFSPAGGWQTDSDYHAVARGIRLFYRLMPLLLGLIAALAWIAPLRRRFGAQTMEHAERMPFRAFVGSLVSLMRTSILLPLLRAMGRDGPCQPLQAEGIPIRIVWARRDHVVPLQRYGEPLYARIPQAERVVLDGIGHVPMYDDPQQIAAQILQVTQAVDAAARPAEERS